MFDAATAPPQSVHRFSTIHTNGQDVPLIVDGAEVGRIPVKELLS